MRLVPALSATVMVLVLVSCSGPDGGPLEGYWTGDHLIFQVNDGQVIEVGTKGVSCQGENDCFAEDNRFFPGSAFPISGSSFSGVLQNPQGTVTLEGQFDTATHALGTYSFKSSNGCCTVSGQWRAELTAPYQDDSEDAAGEDGTGADTGGGDARAPDLVELIPPGASPEQVTASQEVNKIRAVLGLNLLPENAAINDAAQAHALYFEVHCNGYLDSPNLSPHEETPDWPDGYGGVSFAERMAHAGWTGPGFAGWEVMAFNGSPVAAIAGWMDTLYHRIPFVDPATLEFGYGMIPGGCYTWSSGTDVMDFSRQAAGAVDQPVAWPYDGQEGVSPLWMGWESPQPPMPAGHDYPSGPIVTLTFPGGASTYAITAHHLRSSGGQEIEHQYVDHDNDPAGFLDDTIAIYAVAPLQAFTTYEVSVTGTWKGQEQTWTWTFTTGATPRY